MIAPYETKNNQHSQQSPPKRRRYMSPPPASQAVIYILKRDLSDKERSNQLILSPKIPMKFTLSNHGNVVNFGRDPKNELTLDSSRQVAYKKKQYQNNIMVSREVQSISIHTAFSQTCIDCNPISHHYIAWKIRIS